MCFMGIFKAHIKLNIVNTCSGIAIRDLCNAGDSNVYHARY